MTPELTWTVASVVAGAVVAIVGGFWAVSKLAMGQFDRRLDERFKTFERGLAELRTVGSQRLEQLEANYRDLDKDLRKLLIELPREYVARADYIRRETLIEAKIDQLRLYLENWILKGGKTQ